MTNSEAYITRLSAWSPGMENSGEWDEWAQGKRALLRSSGAKSPALSFTDSMFRRRLSQISKMTIQVIHDLMPFGEDTKIFFVSFCGELRRQYQVNKMLIEEKSVSPASFSLSVFNAPAALASIALGLKGGYSALYPAGNSFTACLKAAMSALFCGTAEQLAFVYADEEAPPEYERFSGECFFPAAFGFLLSRAPAPCSVPVLMPDDSQESPLEPQPSPKGEGSPLDFLKGLLLCGKIHVSA
jgi:hypothetical protein